MKRAMRARQEREPVPNHNSLKLENGALSIVSVLRAAPSMGRDREVPCDAAWYGPGSEDWNRGLILLKRQRHLLVHVDRTPGRGLLITRIPGNPDMAIDEATWTAFAGGDKPQLVASIGELYLTFARADLAPFLPVRATIVPFRRSA
jgi:hypothetical protein